MSTVVGQPATPPAAARRQRPTRIGVVSSAGRQKTIKVTVDYQLRHAKYAKYMRRQTALHAHDEKNEARVGDTVEIAECRPLSKTKHWRLLRIVHRSTGVSGAEQARVTGATSQARGGA